MTSGTRSSRARQAVRGVDLRAVILAGGRGTRFWPLGRIRRPKQFLPIVGRTSMVEETVERVRPLVPARAVWPVADAAQTKMLRRLLPRLPAGNFIVEPLARNTAPSLMLATARILLDNPRAVVAVLPADHLIRDRDGFLRKLGAAAAFAAQGRHLVTFGVTPTYPATGYGYIRFSRDAASRKAGEAFYPVLAFKEKPNLAQAEEFLAAGDYAWNSGMFVWRADVFAEKLRAFAPDLVPSWELMLRGLERKSAKTLREAFEKAPALSIDYALMEKAGDVAVCAGDFGWSDVGAWSSLRDIWERDRGGNVLRGESLVLDAEGCLVYNPGKLTVLIGARDLIVVETEDALLVCDAGQDQRVKDVVEMLRKKGRTRHL